MKKYVAILFVGVLALSSLTGCSINEKQKTEDTSISQGTQDSSKVNETAQDVKQEQTEAEEQTVTEVDKENTSTTISNNWEDNQIQLQGKIFTLPFTISDLKEIGFDFKDLGEYVVNPNQAVYGKGLYDAQGNTFSGVYSNLTDKAVDIRETSMTSITVLKDYRGEGNKDLDVVLPGGIQFGASVDDVKSALGEPTSISEVDSSVFLKYKDETQRQHYVDFNFYKGKLISFTMYAQ